MQTGQSRNPIRGIEPRVAGRHNACRKARAWKDQGLVKPRHRWKWRARSRNLTKDGDGLADKKIRNTE